MEEDQEFKYVCKLCSKSFPCGRSLGGHMKSHLIHNNSKDDRKFINSSRVKVSSLSNYTDSGLETGSQAGYGLRENPKKTWRIAGSSEETSVYDSKLCRECGKGFQSLKALIAHMKCHSNSTTNSSENEQDSWTSSKVVDSQSENETTNTIRRRTSTSRRRRTRYMGNTTTSSSNFSVVNNNAYSSVTEIEQEQQEEVAWCLMMLSRDVGPWGGLKFGADFDHSTSDDDSGFSGDPSSLKMNQVSRIKGATLESFKLRKLKNKMLEEEVSVGGFSKIDRTKKTLILEKIELAEAQMGSNKFNSSNKRKLRDAYDHTSKRGKYECGTCNKVFRSYQALGGHRASHKKIKGCFASKIESSDNTTEFDTDLSTDHHPIPSNHSKFSNLIHHQDVVVKAERISTKSKGHSCPICLKVFPTGQALGGHKRSHLIGVSAESSRNHQSTIVIPKPATAEVRDFLDLNLPAPAEEESSTNQAAAAQVFKPWWAGSNHKPYEALVS